MLFNKVEKYCKENNLSIAAFEKKCGMSNGTVSGWKTFKPSMSSIIKISKEMKISVDELLMEDTDGEQYK